jgi:hypothetical protein
MSQLRDTNRGRGTSLAGMSAAVAAVAITSAAAIISFSPFGTAAGAATTRAAVRHRHSVTRGFDGTATTRADTLTVFGAAVAGGAAAAVVEDGVAAASEAEALLTPGASSTSKANATQGMRAGAHGQRCAAPAVPAQLASVVTTSVACSSAFSYSTRSGMAGATSQASAVTINVNLLGLLTQHLPGLPGLPVSVPGVGKKPKLPTLPVAPVVRGHKAVPGVAKVGGAGSTLPVAGGAAGGGNPGPSSQQLPPELAALQQVFGKLPKLPVGGLSLSDLLNEITGAKASQAVRIVLGAANTSALTNNGIGTTEAVAGGAEIDLLPGAGLGGAPLLKVLVGPARVTSVIAAGGHSYAADTPAAVSVAVSSPAGSKVVNLAPGQSETLLAGTPLASTISAGYGTTSTSPDGTENATAQSVTVDLLQGVKGGVDLTLGTTDSAATPPRTAVTTTVTAGAQTPAGMPAASGVPGATSTHTGLAWAGATPYLLGTFLLGMLLLALPRSRRLVLALRRVIR